MPEASSPYVGQSALGSNGKAAFERINLATKEVTTFQLSNSEFCGPLVVADMQVLPGNASAVAISHDNASCGSPKHAGVGQLPLVESQNLIP